jgi:hypothetical protein
MQVDAATQAHNGCSNASPSSAMMPIVDAFVVVDKTATHTVAMNAERVIVGEWRNLT